MRGVRLCVFVQLHITWQSGPVILVILCYQVLVLVLPRGNKVYVCVCMCACVSCAFIKLHKSFYATHARIGPPKGGWDQ